MQDLLKHVCVKLDDGVLQLMIVKNCSRCELLQLLFSIDEGKHVNQPCVETYKAYAYRLEPSRNSSGGDGIYSLDGEAIEYGPVQAAVLPSSLLVFSLVDNRLTSDL